MDKTRITNANKQHARRSAGAGESKEIIMNKIDDTISRAKAIEALRAMQTYKLFAGDDMLLIDQAGAQTELMMLPPAQLGTNLAEVGTDCISRQAAITALSNEIVKRRLLDEMYDGCIDEFQAEEILKKLPPAQPERIIHCKDCEWWAKQENSPQGRCALSGMYPTGGWFCGNARMREVTE